MSAIDRFPQADHPLLALFQCQNCTSVRSSTGVPFPPQTLYLWRDGTMGVSVTDNHGYWFLTADDLVLSYNYRGRADYTNVEVRYGRIASTDSWLLRPGFQQGHSWCVNTTVLIPADEFLLNNTLNFIYDGETELLRPKKRPRSQ